MSAKTVLIFLMAILAIASAVQIPAELQEYIDDLHSLCIKKSGITDADHASYQITNKDHKMMCYMKCLMLESNWMNPDGVIQYDFILDNIHPDVKDLLEQALKQCKEIPDGADLCEKSYNFNECMFRADTENWFFV